MALSHIMPTCMKAVWWIWLWIACVYADWKLIAYEAALPTGFKCKGMNVHQSACSIVGHGYHLHIHSHALPHPAATTYYLHDLVLRIVERPPPTNIADSNIHDEDGIIIVDTDEMVLSGVENAHDYLTRTISFALVLSPSGDIKVIIGTAKDEEKEGMQWVIHHHPTSLVALMTWQYEWLQSIDLALDCDCRVRVDSGGGHAADSDDEHGGEHTSDSDDEHGEGHSVDSSVEHGRECPGSSVKRITYLRGALLRQPYAQIFVPSSPSSDSTDEYTISEAPDDSEYVELADNVDGTTGSSNQGEVSSDSESSHEYDNSSAIDDDAPAADSKDLTNLDTLDSRHFLTLAYIDHEDPLHPTIAIEQNLQ